jgi:hypothetical protein
MSRTEDTLNYPKYFFRYTGMRRIDPRACNDIETIFFYRRVKRDGKHENSAC